MRRSRETLESLKQGNALKIETLELIKEGAVNVFDDMIAKAHRENATYEILGNDLKEVIRIPKDCAGRTSY